MNNNNHNRNSTVLCFILLVYFVRQDAFADREDKSEEIEELHSEANSSAEILGPPDSHEAMNNREITSKLTRSNRGKRSYEFLMGLVNNNSKFEATNVDLPPHKGKLQNGEMATNEALLELMVKIAADPEQWEKVHGLLQKIDNDLLISKKIFDRIQNSSIIQPLTNEEKIFFEKKQELAASTQPSTASSINLISSTEPKKNLEVEEERNNDELQNTFKTSTNETKKLTQVHNDQSNKKSLLNQTKLALKSNNWPDFQSEGRLVYKPESKSDRPDFKYPWPNENKLGSKSYSRNFAYHRVTGHPLFHTNFDKNPKAYIAVSVIAPKPLHSRSQEEDLILENELRQLKPWTHKQNLKNMAAIRSRWVIESANNKETTAP